MQTVARPDVDETHNPWRTLSSEIKYHNPWISVREDQVQNPGGGQGIYGVVTMKNKALGIVPIDAEGNTWLVGQYRYPLNEYSWEIPMGGGLVELDILESAQRELKEETGLTAARWTRIARLHTSNSVTDEEGFVYLAEDLTPGAAGTRGNRRPAPVEAAAGRSHPHGDGRPDYGRHQRGRPAEGGERCWLPALSAGFVAACEAAAARPCLTFAQPRNGQLA